MFGSFSPRVYVEQCPLALILRPVDLLCSWACAASFTGLGQLALAGNRFCQVTLKPQKDNFKQGTLPISSIMYQLQSALSAWEKAEQKESRHASRMVGGCGVGVGGGRGR